MNGDPIVGQKYGDAAGYDSYMGSWSTALSPLFLEFAAIEEPANVLDVGCGTGNLLATLVNDFRAGALTGIDPSATLLNSARRRPELAGVSLLEGTAERLPFENGRFDHCLSLLVLQEFPDRLVALSEMRRVTRPGGIVAACQWDFARMPVIDALVEAITAINPPAGRWVSRTSPRAFADEAELHTHWTQAGFGDVATGRIQTTRIFDSFDDLWLPLLTGSTPSTLALAALSVEEQDAIRHGMQIRFDGEASVSGLQVTAQALVVRGRA